MDTPPPSRGSHALRGSLLLAAVVSPAVLALLVLGLTREQQPLVEAAFRLTVLVLASGAVGGAVYDATSGMRTRGAFARAASWWLVAGSVSALLLIALRIFLTPLLAPGGSDALYVMRLTGMTGVKYLGGAVLVFGWAMADVTAPDASSGNSRVTNRSSIGTLAIAAIAVVIRAMSSLAGNPPPERVLPRNAVEARRVIADAERDSRAHPDDGNAQFAYGLSLMFLHRYAEARPALARAEQLLPDEAWASSALGWVLLQEKNYAGALPHIQRAIRIDPDYDAAYENLAFALWKLDRRAEAETAYGHAVKLDPDNPDLAAYYASLLFQERKTGRAIAQIQRAIRLDSTDARYHAEAGYFLRSRARFADARAEFQRAVHLDPSPAGSWVQLAITDYLMGDARGADTAFTAAAKRDSSVSRNAQLRIMWESARKGRTVTLESQSAIEFRLDSTATTRH